MSFDILDIISVFGEFGTTSPNPDPKPGPDPSRATAHRLARPSGSDGPSRIILLDAVPPGAMP